MSRYLAVAVEMKAMQPCRRKLERDVRNTVRRIHFGRIIPCSPCRFRSIRGCVRWVASGEREPASSGLSRSPPAEPGPKPFEGNELGEASLALSQAGTFPVAIRRVAVAERLRTTRSDDDLNGMHERLRPFWTQLAQGNVPLQRFFDARHVVQAVFARKRFAGWTFGRPMLK